VLFTTHVDVATFEQDEHCERRENNEADENFDHDLKKARPML
jgi:hypothetical protein